MTSLLNAQLGGHKAARQSGRSWGAVPLQYPVLPSLSLAGNRPRLAAGTSGSSRQAPNKASYFLFGARAHRSAPRESEWKIKPGGNRKDWQNPTLATEAGVTARSHVRLFCQACPWSVPAKTIWGQRVVSERPFSALGLIAVFIKWAFTYIYILNIV